MKFLFSVFVALFMAIPAFASLNNQNNKQVQLIPLGSISADADVYGIYLPQKVKITGVKVVNGGAISQSDSDYAVITLKNGSTTLATHSTKLTGGTGALSSNTPAAATLASGLVSNGGVDVAAGSWLKANYDETGTYAMTLAFVIVEYYVQ